MNIHIQENTDATQVVASTRYVCTANHGFAPYAQEELRRLFGSVKSTVLVSGEVLLVTLPFESQEIERRFAEVQPLFLRHMFPVSWQWTVDVENSNRAWEDELVEYLLADGRINGAKVAIQPRKSEGSLWQESALSFKDMLQARLDESKAEFVVRDADLIVSVFIGKDQVLVGISTPQQNLSDWNGGAIRFQREEGQISRAKFKLLEAESVFDIDFSAFHEALDIGAAPGGWSSFLLERGLKVTAVDPAKMHPSILDSPRLTHIRKNADSVKFREGQFDLLVCDMSWNPKQTAKMVIDLLYALVPGGTAVVTVKLMSKKPMALIQEVISLFEASQMQVQRAKQLFHNRDEITLYMIKY
ncbi:SAM-dependent methyltransferase [Paenibacillus sp. D2_2]|uniref:SAM-dependent methyltransferase n=1 Tax=Paenibacillus sp. D2_2 TaxID=3073092 RepID=UPI0028159310|nr:SAM-dependent methyltransferase [Paenibacillus sp. D2_2]WMT42911.1 SAM-dependent methyltransferase [Paenibacillus sp. D2_2]